MAKLYPPYIEGTLPAFCLTEEGNGYFTIPFEHNRAVSENDAEDITLKAKSVQNDELVAGSIYGDYDRNTRTIKFQVEKFTVKTKSKDKYEETNWKVSIGQFYKIQIAYVTDEVGYFSTVGVIKCTSKPTLLISGLQEGEVNSTKTKFIGEFKQPSNGDPAEKVYSSNFIIADLNGNVLVESGDSLHNVQNDDDSYTAKDEFIFSQDLPMGEVYTIQYNVVTNNELYVSSPKYYITQQLSLDSDLNSDLIAEFDPEEGYVELSLVGKTDEEGNKTSATGAFMIAREDSLIPGRWDILYHFSLGDEYPDRKLFKDFTVEHGKTYTYSIQRVNKSGVFSDRIKSNIVYVDFEDIFVYDGERQLKLRFNPQVSSFKTQLAESRTDTIGSRYPFFFRNTTIGYKVVPVSALLSMLTDDNEFFTTYEEILRDRIPELDRHKTNKIKDNEIPNYTNLTAKNQTSERLFKMKVLNWFNNGKVKLFRSPTEGNLLVRFMDTSLTPNTTVGRMLHTINTTAYECAECIYNNLVNLNIIRDTEFTNEDFDNRIDAWREVSIVGGQGDFPNEDKYSENLIKSDSSTVSTTDIKFYDFTPGSVLKIVFDPSGSYNDLNSTEITIGTTGSYELSRIAPVYGIYLEKDPIYSDSDSMISTTGKILYHYMTAPKDKFDSIINTMTTTGEYRQVVGDGETKYPFSLNDARRRINLIEMAKFYKRPVHFLYYSSDKTPQTGKWNATNLPLYFDYNLENPYNPNYSPFGLYILQNDSIVDLDGKTVNLGEYPNEILGRTVERTADDLKVPLTNTARDNHIFEQYYIDYLKASDPKADEVWREEELKGNSNLLVLDGWNNTINVLSNSDDFWTVTIGDNDIDLRDIEYYELTDYSSGDVKLSNGVYGELFFQQLVTEYSFEKDEPVASKKTDWERAKAEAKTNGLVHLEESVEIAYKEYVNAIENELNELSTKE